MAQIPHEVATAERRRRSREKLERKLAEMDAAVALTAAGRMRTLGRAWVHFWRQLLAVPAAFAQGFRSGIRIHWATGQLQQAMKASAKAKALRDGRKP